MTMARPRLPFSTPAMCEIKLKISRIDPSCSLSMAGPGSSSVWLHIGMLGPKRVSFPGDGTEPITPPARMIENEYSVLDVCDLVFIDPVSTGYSRAKKNEDAKDFHDIEADIKSVGEFIRIWITENERWDSPKFLCGESYGGIRAAGLAEHLQDRHGMSLNGVVLLSSLLDFRTLLSAQGSHLPHQIFLPAFATTALYHEKISGDRAEILKETREFASGEYALALLKGTAIDDEELEAASAKLEKLTGLPADFWRRKQLRIDPSEFRAELLRDEGKIVGRFDSRVAWNATETEADYATYDPSYSLAIGAFSTAMLSYLGEDLGWKEDQPLRDSHFKGQPLEIRIGQSSGQFHRQTCGRHTRQSEIESSCDGCVCGSGDSA